MNNILCPVDFSKASLTAVEFAAKIAQKHKSSLLLLHVITSGEFTKEMANSGSETFDRISSEVEEKLGLLSKEINNNAGEDYEMCGHMLVSGAITEEIIKVCEKVKISLIVMGTTGAKDINELRIGSNTVRVIENSRIPVMSIPVNASYHDFNRIVYGSEFIEDDKIYLQQVINFAIPFDSRIYLVHVSPPGDSRGKHEHKEYSKIIRSYIDYKKLNIEEFMSPENVSIALEHTLNVHDAHLLVLVHKQRNFLERIFHSSLTRKMAYLTNFPLLALRN